MNLDPVALVASGAIVIFLVQQAKRWIPTSFLPLLAMVLGIAVQLVNDLMLGVATGPASTWTSVVIGAGIGMAAAGTYDLAGRAGATIPPATITLDDTWDAATPPPVIQDDTP